jgi:hypothetical protein
VSADSAPELVAVAELAARGLAVFPLPPGGRRPSASGWQERCLTDPAAVLRSWPGGANVGVGCRASRIVGLDLDLDGDGLTSLADLTHAHTSGWAEALDTLTVRTPSGGRHLYYRASTWCTITSSSGPDAGLGPGIDVRGPGRRGGGYLIGPGSVVGGTAYVITRDAPIRPLPGWLERRLTGERLVRTPPRHPGQAAEPWSR